MSSNSVVQTSNQNLKSLRPGKVVFARSTIFLVLHGVAKPSSSGFGTAAKVGPEIMLSYRILDNTGDVDSISDFYSENSIQKVYNHKDIVTWSQCSFSIQMSFFFMLKNKSIL
jgi:hypothetical protein